jgi:hypothetical protein
VCTRRGFALQFGDEVVGVAAVEGSGVFDDAAVVEEGAALDEQPGAAFGQVHQAGLFGVERDGAQALQRARRAQAHFLEGFVQRVLDQ